MVTRYDRKGPPSSLIVMIAMTLVIGCFFIWSLGLDWLGGVLNTVNQNATAEQRQTLTSAFPTFDLGPSPTPVPECMTYEVSVSSALMRRCPAERCQIRERRPYQSQVCVYGMAANTADYPRGEEWYVVDLNPNGAFRDLVYMHRSVLRSLAPTPTPSPRPLPTVTLTPSPLPTLTFTPSATLTPLPTVTPTPARQEF